MAGAQVTIKSNLYIDQTADTIRRGIVGNIRRAAAYARAAVVRNLSTSGRASGPSEPGEFPHAQTGLLRNSIREEVDEEEMTAIVGTNVEYGGFLELGTSRMEPRPFLTRTITEEHEAITKLLSKPIGGA